jgi:ATP-dependent Clp protease ATP-binding subunit ClpA
MEDKVLAELKKHFRPEFLNRVDDVIIFQSLDESELARIVDIQLGRLEQRLAQQNLTLDVDAAAKKRCWPRKATTRNSARARSNARFKNTCSTRSRRSCWLGDFKPNDKIKVTVKGDALVFHKK